MTNTHHGPGHPVKGVYPSVHPADGQFGASPAPTEPLPGHMQVALPQLEPQPWVREIWSWLGRNTVGVARVDLRRPMPPSLDQYEGGNLLFASYAGPPATSTRAGGQSLYPRAPPLPPQPKRGTRGQRQQPAPPQYVPATQFQQADTQGTYYAPLPPRERSGPPSGARVKITRSFLLWRNGDRDRDGARPLVDLGGGINIDMDRQRVEPVLRLKLGGLVSFKASPLGVVKVSKTLPVGNTGVGLKVRYEVPIQHAAHFWRPPARLMVRLDQMPGTGVRLTPTGLECDQTVMRFGKSVTMRASAGLNFPRTIPFDPENDEVGLKVHRLSMKALW